MVRSMYSGVSGMRTHQTAMDTIGNNIANVNTYGFKGSRTTFADIYYQSLRGASAASATRGGVNASQVGVGAQVRSVDLMMTRSSFTQTDMTMDLAIDGEGFLQVMDADGNKYYTRAGQLLFDANGNLVDSKGNFVLGTNGEPFGKDPGSDKIQVNLGSADAKPSQGSQTINDVEFTISASENSEDGNVGISFMVDSSMALDDSCMAEVTDSGIVVKVNASKSFATLEEFSSAMNDAIQKASADKLGVGKKHPAGDFSLISDKTLDWPMTGAELINNDTAIKRGSVGGWSSGTGVNIIYVTPATTPPTVDHIEGGAQGFSIKEVGTQFMSGYNFMVPRVGTDPATGNPAYIKKDGTFTTDLTQLTADDLIESHDFSNVEFNITGDKGDAHQVTVTINPQSTGVGTDVYPPAPATGITYEGTIPAGQEGSGSIKLKNTATGADADDYIQVGFKDAENIKKTGYEIMTDHDNDPNTPDQMTWFDSPVTFPDKLTLMPSTTPKAGGLGTKTFLLEGGTEGGPQGIESLTGVSIGTDGVITGHHDLMGDVKIGRIDLAVFVNPSGLTTEGGTYFATSPNSGTMTLVKPGTGGSGQVVAGSLELSNVDLSREFTDMIKTQRGYQANSRIITVTDTMLEELVNLKR